MTISWEDPRLDFETNVTGTFNVLEVARLDGIPVASCSTIHTYGTGINDEITDGGARYVREPAAIAESHEVLTGRLTPLHASKYAGEVYTQTYAHTFGVKAAAFRYTGIYGPRQFGAEDHGWVANFTIRNLTGRPIRIFGNGKQTRDILYASDAARAFWDYAQHPVPGVYNIGGGEPNAVSLLESIRLIESITGRPSTTVFEADRPGDLRYFVSNFDKAAQAFGFQPSVRPADGIAKTRRLGTRQPRRLRGQRMKALILAGGRGSRLGSLREQHAAPKPLLEVGGKRLIDFSLQNAVAIGVTEIIVVVSAFTEAVINHYGSAYRGTPIRYKIQNEPHGVVHAIECAAGALDGAGLHAHAGRRDRHRCQPRGHGRALSRANSCLPSSASSPSRTPRRSRRPIRSSKTVGRDGSSVSWRSRGGRTTM
jgi:nucleoside-diphosphate-sugar epimerase